MQGQQEMEDTLTEQLQQDWVIAEEATEWVGSHLDGWRELLARMGLEANTMTVGCLAAILQLAVAWVGVFVWRTEFEEVWPPSHGWCELVLHN